MSDERRDNERTGRSEGRSKEGRTDDAIDALLSAGMDDALSEAERAELNDLLVGKSVELRSEAFDEVDAALRSLAEEPADAARIAASLETLRERLDWADEPPAEWRPASILGRRLVFGSGLAAAAAVMLFLAIGTGDDARESGEGVGAQEGQTASIRDPAGEAEFEEEGRVTALGYADWSGDLSELGLASPEDLEIVEQLELLDFLATREAEGQG